MAVSSLYRSVRPLTRAIALVGLGALSVGVPAETTLPPVYAIQRLDLDRYMGQWYEIARLPNQREAECASDVTSTYERRTEIAMRVISSCKHADGEEERHEIVARVRDITSYAKFEFRHAPRALAWLPFVWDDYWVLQVGPAYEYALVGTPEHQALWILSRTPAIEPAAYDRLVAQAASQGFDTQKLLRTPHSASTRTRPVSP